MIRQRSSFLHSQCCIHHIPFSNVMSSYLQSVGDRIFCIANAKTPFAIQKVRSLTPLLSLLLDWEGNATVCVFDNHHILKVTSSSLQSVGDRTFCIGQIQSSVFNIGADSYYAEGASGQPATTTTTATAVMVMCEWNFRNTVKL